MDSKSRQTRGKSKWGGGHDNGANCPIVLESKRAPLTQWSLMAFPFLGLQLPSQLALKTSGQWVGTNWVPLKGTRPEAAAVLRSVALHWMGEQRRALCPSSCGQGREAAGVNLPGLLWSGAVPFKVAAGPSLPKSLGGRGTLSLVPTPQKLLPYF